LILVLCFTAGLVLAQTDIPILKTSGAVSIDIVEGWTGMPGTYEASYHLSIYEDGATGEALFSLSRVETPTRQSVAVSVPKQVVTAFLATLAATPTTLLEGDYNPPLLRTDDYPVRSGQ